MTNKPAVSARIPGEWLPVLEEWRNNAHRELVAMQYDGALSPRLASYLENMVQQIVMLRRDMEVMFDEQGRDD